MQPERVLSKHCSVCGAECEMFEHRYSEGRVDSPTRQWMIVAPLRYLGEQGFCSPECCVEGARQADKIAA